MQAREMEDTPEMRQWLYSLFRFHGKVNLALIIGWYVSTCHRMFYHETDRKFPLLHVYGLAGSGKTFAIGTMQRMFYVANEPTWVPCGTSTHFVLKQALFNSSGLPAVLDEYKPVELGAKRHNEIMYLLRNAYDNAPVAMGGISDGSADSSWREASMLPLSASVVYIGEAKETQTALEQRSLTVGFVQSDQRYDHYTTCNDMLEMAPILGKKLITKTLLEETVESRKAAIREVMTMLELERAKGIHDRQIFNLAVVICGWRFLKSALHDVFGDLFDQDCDDMVSALITYRSEFQVAAIPEIVKCLSDMALMSRTEDPDGRLGLREGTEYAVLDGKLHLRVREAHLRYLEWVKAKGFDPYYKNSDSFYAAIGQCPATTNKNASMSPLRSSGSQLVSCFDLEKLRQDGCEEFKLAVIGN